ncbi:MAG: hypothetical protein IKN55_11145 [Oscillospiraceae bacterium]|nr:hypothetical protein [Oscillospiraceae bacterium]
MNKRNEQIKAVMSDEAFVKSCIEAENEEAVQKLFADKGVEMSLTEIELMKELIGAAADGTLTGEQLEKLANGGELSEDELLEVAGGAGPSLLSESDLLPIVRKTMNEVAKKTGSSGKIIGGIAAGVVAVGAIGYGVYKFSDEIASGAETAYGWVKENITRW